MICTCSFWILIWRALKRGVQKECIAVLLLLLSTGVPSSVTASYQLQRGQAGGADEE
jgi:hypothetical protein